MMGIKQVSEYELYDILEKKITGVYYYVSQSKRYYCYLVTKEKKTSNIWNNKDFAFKWMNSVLKTNFANK